MICLRNCPAEAIIGGKGLIHIVDQDKCTKCGTCLEVCPSRFDAVVKLSGVPVPEPLQEEERVLRRGRSHAMAGGSEKEGSANE